MALIDTLNVYYSGGVSNSDPALSGGGAIGALVPRLSTISNTNPIPGIFIEDSSNINGSIDLIYTAAIKAFKFSVNSVNSNQGSLHAFVNQSGFRKAVESGEDRILYIRHEPLLLPAVDTTVTISITSPSQNILFPNIDAQQSLNGLVDYRLLYIRNDDATNNVVLKKVLYKSGDVSGSAFAISKSSQTAVNEVPVPGEVADPSTIPSMFGSFTPNVTMTPGDTYYFWIRRTINALNITTNPNSTGYFELTASY
jgi:hypothetical protein